MNRIVRLPMPQKVLLAEDDAASADAYRFGLERAGFIVIVARDDAEAVEIAKQRRDLDVVVLDLACPPTGGLKALAGMQQSGFVDETPVIFVSNRVQDFRTAVLVGASKCMTRSGMTPAQLVSWVRAVGPDYARGA